MQINQSHCWEWSCFALYHHCVSFAVVDVSSVAAEALAAAGPGCVADASSQATSVVDEHVRDIAVVVASSQAVVETTLLALVSDAVEITVATVEVLFEMVVALRHCDELVGG